MPSPAWRTWSRFVRISKPYFTSADSRRLALGLLAALFAFLLATTGLNVGISYVGRYFMTALADRRTYEVYLYALIYLGIFAVAAAVGAFSRYFELLLGLRGGSGSRNALSVSTSPVRPIFA